MTKNWEWCLTGKDLKSKSTDLVRHIATYTYLPIATAKSEVVCEPKFPETSDKRVQALKWALGVCKKCGHLLHRTEHCQNGTATVTKKLVTRMSLTKKPVERVEIPCRYYGAEDSDMSSGSSRDNLSDVSLNFSDNDLNSGYQTDIYECEYQ